MTKRTEGMEWWSSHENSPKRSPPSSAGTQHDWGAAAMPGHSDGQVGVILRTDGITLFFTADHIAHQNWFVEELGRGLADGRPGLGSLLGTVWGAGRRWTDTPVAATCGGSGER